MEDTWVDVDWSLTWLPSEEQRVRSLQRLRLRPVPVLEQPVLQVVDAFRSMLGNGGAHVSRFEVVESDDVAAWFVSRNRDEYGLADRLVRSSTFAATVPEVAGPGPAAPTGFARSSPLVLDGLLARSLQWGGAYTDPVMPGAEAKALGSAFCSSLFGDRYDETDVDCSGARWTYWFKGVAWDETWVVTDRRHRLLTVLCITDVD